MPHFPGFLGPYRCPDGHIGVHCARGTYGYTFGMAGLTNIDWRALTRLIQPFLPIQLEWRGVFDPHGEYRLNNLVYFSNGLWIAKAGPLVGAVPGVDPRWDLLLQSSSSGGDAMVPYYVPATSLFNVPEFKQALYAMDIVVDGYLVVDGFLIEVD